MFAAARVHGYLVARQAQDIYHSPGYRRLSSASNDPLPLFVLRSESQINLHSISLYPPFGAMRSRSGAGDPACRHTRHVMRTSHEERVCLYSVRARLGLAYVRKWDAQRRDHADDENAADMEVERIKQELDTEELCLRYDMLNENDRIANLASADAGLVMAHMKCFAVNSVEERYEELLRRRWDAWYPAVAPPTLEATAAERAWLISSRKQFALVFAKQQYDASHKVREGMQR